MNQEPENHGTKWTVEEEDRLRELAVLSNNELEHIGRLMGRTAVAIRDRAYRLGLAAPFNPQKPFGFEWKKDPYDTQQLTEREDNIFRNLSGKFLSISQSQLLLTLD